MGEEIRKEDGSVLISDDVKRRLQGRLQRRTVLIVLTCLLVGGTVFGLFSFSAMKFLFSVEHVQCGQSSYYTSDEILLASGIQKGKPIFFLSEEEIKGSVLEKMPFLSDLKVEKVYPDTVRLVPVEERPLFYFVADIPENKYVVVSESQKVLAMYDDEMHVRASFGGIYRVEMPSLLYIVSGQQLQFKERGDSDYIPGLLNLLKDSDFFSEVQSVDLSNRFEITVYCRRNGLSAYRIYLGNKKDLSEKIEFAEGIRGRIPEDFEGLIGVEDPTEGYADPDDK